MQGRNGFGCNFRENQNHDCQCDCRDRDACIAVQTNGDDSCDSRCQNIDQIVTNQDETNQSIRPREQFAGAQRTLMTLLLQVL